MASRAVPVPGPKADPGTQAATADPGTPAATADPGTPAAMADPGTQVAMEGSPPPKFSLGSSPSQGGAQEPWKASWTGPAEGR